MRNCLQAQGGCEETIPTHPKKRKWEELDWLETTCKPVQTALG
jgi:hypothetical protein